MKKVAAVCLFIRSLHAYYPIRNGGLLLCIDNRVAMSVNNA